jgi:G3E family GTPase
MSNARARPVTVIGGYLGTGKTTLINTLLRQAQGRLRLAVMVNDFGETPIDADLIEGQTGDLLTLAGGCVCCSYGSDLMEALAAVAERHPSPDHVLIESSGVALPSAIAGAITLRPDYQLDGVVGLISAAAVLGDLADRYLADTIERQVLDAQLLILNHCDRAAPDHVEQATRWVTRTAPTVPLLPTAHADVPLDLVLGPQGQSTGTLSLGHVPTPGFSTLAIDLPDPVDLDALGRLLTEPTSGVLRAKAIVLDPLGRSWLIHTVGAHVFRSLAPAGAGRHRLRAIGLTRRLDPGLLRSRLRQSPPEDARTG